MQSVSIPSDSKADTLNYFAMLTPNETSDQEYITVYLVTVEVPSKGRDISTIGSK